MKYIQFLVALLAASIFVIPATSMQDNGNAVDGFKAQIEQPSEQQQCDCPNAMAAFGIMNQGKQSAPCGEKMAQQGPNDNAGPKSMMDGKQPAPCGDKMAQQGPNDNAGPKSMMDNVVPK